MKAHWITIVALVGYGCLGGGESTEQGSGAVKEDGPTLLNGSSYWGGVYEAEDDTQEIQKLEILPCWMRVTYKGGATLSGNYEARSWGQDGLLEVLVSDWSAPGEWPVGGRDSRYDGYGAFAHGQVAIWQMLQNSGYLSLSNVRAPGWTNGLSDLRQVSGTAGTEEQRWCLAEGAFSRPAAQLPNGSPTWVPRGMSVANGALVGTYRAIWPAEVDETNASKASEDALEVAAVFGVNSGRRTQTVTIGACYMSVCDQYNLCARGNYGLLRDQDSEWYVDGVIDLDGYDQQMEVRRLYNVHELKMHTADTNWDGLLLWGDGERVVLERDPQPLVESLDQQWCTRR